MPINNSIFNHGAVQEPSLGNKIWNRNACIRILLYFVYLKNMHAASAHCLHRQTSALLCSTPVDEGWREQKERTTKIRICGRNSANADFPSRDEKQTRRPHPTRTAERTAMRSLIHACRASTPAAPALMHRRAICTIDSSSLRSHPYQAPMDPRLAGRPMEGLYGQPVPAAAASRPPAGG